jgi:hypothetical protein
MRFFRRRADVGKYEDPPARPLAPFETVVDDGVMIALAAVRLAAKNRIILSAVRDRLDFDEVGLLRFVRTVLARVAEENDETAERVDAASQDPGLAPGVALDVAITIRDSHRRRPEVHRALAARLRDLADDPPRVAELVAQAQDAAAAELTRAVAAQAAAPSYADDARYEEERPERVAGLAVDLLDLAEQAEIRRERAPERSAD